MPRSQRADHDFLIDDFEFLEGDDEYFDTSSEDKIEDEGEGLWAST